MTSSTEQQVAQVLPEIIALRHELHAHPEIRFEEKWTSDRIAQFLDEAKIPYDRGFAHGTGIVATITGEGAATVVPRADMDALEIHEETGQPHASIYPGYMHACGHDGHTACLCGAAKILHEQREHLNGTVRCVFQPAEEQAAAGRFIVEDGVLDGADAAFALHGWPQLPLGKVGLRSGPTMASGDFFTVDILGQGCHAADPGAGVDPILVAAHIITAFQSIVSRELDPWESGVVSVTQVQAGSSSNIIPDSARLVGTFRALSRATRKTLLDAIQRIATDTARAHRATAQVTVGEASYPPLYNDDAMADFVRDTVRATFGSDALVEVAQPTMASEDFAYYLQKVPGTFAFLGVNPDPETPYPPLHNAHYEFPDAALPVGMGLLAEIAIRFLASR